MPPNQRISYTRGTWKKSSSSKAVRTTQTAITSQLTVANGNPRKVDQSRHQRNPRSNPNCPHRPQEYCSSQENARNIALLSSSKIKPFSQPSTPPFSRACGPNHGVRYRMSEKQRRSGRAKHTREHTPQCDKYGPRTSWAGPYP